MIRSQYTQGHAPERLSRSQTSRRIFYHPENQYRIAALHMRIMSIPEASGISLVALIASAEQGNSTGLSRHGRIVAEIVSAEDISELRRDHDTLRDAALAMARFATETGARTDLDQAIELFGLTRAELEAEIATDIDPDRS